MFESIYFNKVIFFSYYIGIGSFIFSIFFACFALLLHYFEQKNIRYRKEFVGKIRPLLTRAIFEPDVNFPLLANKDRVLFLEIWNHVHESLKGSSSENLNHLARRIKIDDFALTLLKKKRKLLLSLWSLGHLKEKRGWDKIVKFCSDSNADLSLTAAQALLRIDSAQALPLLLTFLKEREDWPADKVVLMLKEVSPVMLDKLLSEATLTANPKMKARLIYYLEMLKLPSTSSVLRNILSTPVDDEIVVRGLRYLHSPVDLELIRSFLKQKDVGVRREAVQALSRIGTPADLESLTQLLSDPDWGVRYCAAQALIKFPFVGRKGIEEIQKKQTHLKAKEIITHVLAEEAA